MPRKPGYSKNEKFIMGELRRIAHMYEPRKECIRAARVAPNQYKCAECKQDHFRFQDMKADHVDPVIHPEIGFIDIATFAYRLFPELCGWQALCDPCHKAKTKQENALRTETGSWKQPKAST